MLVDNRAKELNAMKETLREIYNQVKKEPKTYSQMRMQYALLKSLSQIIDNAIAGEPSLFE